jgi:NADH-quinone oxidoreductase subunit N
MATVVKGAGIIAFFRLFTLCFGMADYFWGMPLAVLAALTIAVGNLSALFQTSFKRMLAWSSVAHAGYLLMVVLNHAKPGGEALIVYVLGYGAASLIAFGI